MNIRIKTLTLNYQEVLVVLRAVYAEPFLSVLLLHSCLLQTDSVSSGIIVAAPVKDRQRAFHFP